MATGADASRGYSVEGLKITPPVGAFGGIHVGSCDLVTYAGCKIKTFTVENVGSQTISIGGFGIVDSDPSTAALAPDSPESGCAFLPVVGGYWALVPGASCTIDVAFGPGVQGRVKNELHIWHTDQFDPIAVVPLAGVGTPSKS